MNKRFKRLENAGPGPQTRTGENFHLSRLRILLFLIKLTMQNKTKNALKTNQITKCARRRS